MLCRGVCVGIGFVLPLAGGLAPNPPQGPWDLGAATCSPEACQCFRRLALGHMISFPGGWLGHLSGMGTPSRGLASQLASRPRSSCLCSAGPAYGSS